jgi:hypothetical protein
MGTKAQPIRVVSEWTFDTLKEYVDARINASDLRLSADVAHAKDAVGIAQDAAQRANDKAEKASDDRFAGHNEFNQRIDKILANTVQRETFMQFKDQTITDKLSVEARFAKLEGTTEGTKDTNQSYMARLMIVIAVVGTLASVVGAFIGKQL